RTADARAVLVAPRPARVADDGIGLSAAGVAWRWHMILPGERAAQHELEPVRARILAGDQEGVDAAILIEEEVTGIGLHDPGQELQTLPKSRAHRKLEPRIPEIEISVFARLRNEVTRSDEARHHEADLVEVTDDRNPIRDQIKWNEQVADSKHQYEPGQKARSPVEQARNQDAQLSGDSTLGHLLAGTRFWGRKAQAIGSVAGAFACCERRPLYPSPVGSRSE